MRTVKHNANLPANCTPDENVTVKLEELDVLEQLEVLK